MVGPELFGLFHEIAIATDHEFRIHVLHSGDQGFKASSFIHCPLVEDISFLFFRDVQGPKQRHVPDHFEMLAIHFQKFFCNGRVYGIVMIEPGNADAFDPFPELIYPGSGGDLLHFTEKLMRIIHPFDTSQPGGIQYREDGVEVYRADEVRFFEQEVKEEAEVVFDIKSFSLLEKAVQSFLMERLLVERDGVFLFSSHQFYLVTCMGKRTADPDHSLIESTVIGDGEDQFFHWGILVME